MNAKLANYMTTLGLVAMAFYGILMAAGTLSLNVMPQFIISAVIFLSSGRIMKKAARRMRSREAVAEMPLFAFINWKYVNWTASFFTIVVMAVIMLKPIGVAPAEALHGGLVSDLFYAGAVP